MQVRSRITGHLLCARMRVIDPAEGRAALVLAVDDSPKSAAVGPIEAGIAYVLVSCTRAERGLLRLAGYRLAQPDQHESGVQALSWVLEGARPAAADQQERWHPDHPTAVVLEGEISVPSRREWAEKKPSGSASLLETSPSDRNRS